MPKSDANQFPVIGFSCAITVCDRRYKNGNFLVILSGRPKPETVHLWKYNKFTKKWVEIMAHSLSRPIKSIFDYVAIQLDDARLAVLLRNDNASFPIYLCLYDVRNTNEVTVEQIQNPISNHIFPVLPYFPSYVWLSVTCNCNKIYLTGAGYNTFQIFVFNLEDHTWSYFNEPLTQPTKMVSGYKIAVCHDNVFIIGWTTVLESENRFVVFTFDLIRRQWRQLSLNPDLRYGYPEQMYHRETVLFKNYAYAISGPTKYGLRSIWRLDLVTLQWNLLEVGFPKVTISFTMDINDTGNLVCVHQQYMRNKEPLTKLESPNVYEINLDGSVRTLQELCLEKSIEFIQSATSRRITDFSIEQLFHFGLCNKFITQLRC